MFSINKFASFCSQIKIAQRLGKDKINVKFSKLNYGFAQCLLRAGLVLSIRQKNVKLNKYLILTLKYHSLGNPLICNIKLRLTDKKYKYYKWKKIFKNYSKSKVLIYITNKGILTDSEAWWNSTGGKLLCEIDT